MPRPYRSLVLIAIAVAASLGVSAQTPLDTIRQVLIESYTGTWCGPCVESADHIRGMEKFPYNIQVSIHTGNYDPMATPETDSLYKLFLWQRGIPMNVFERTSRGWHPEKPAGAYLEIEPRYDRDTRMLSATVRAWFPHPPMQKDLRLNLYVIEDSVVGSGWQYDQVNGKNKTPGSPYYGLGDFLAGYAHRRVLRAMPSGVMGTPGVIPPAPDTITRYQYTYQYSMPASFVESRVRLVAFVSIPPNGLDISDVLNAVEVPLIPSSSGIPVARTDDDARLDISPMPLSGGGTVSFWLPRPGDVVITLHDIMGRRVETIASERMTAGEHRVSVDLSGIPTGSYRMLVEAGDVRLSGTVVVIR